MFEQQFSACYALPCSDIEIIAVVCYVNWDEMLIVWKVLSVKKSCLKVLKGKTSFRKRQKKTV
jgi:hypothetical protein